MPQMFHTGWKGSFLPPRDIRLFLTDSRQKSVLFWRYRKKTRGGGGREELGAEDRLASVHNQTDMPGFCKAVMVISATDVFVRNLRRPQPKAWKLAFVLRGVRLNYDVHGSAISNFQSFSTKPSKQRRAIQWTDVWPGRLDLFPCLDRRQPLNMFCVVRDRGLRLFP